MNLTILNSSFYLFQNIKEIVHRSVSLNEVHLFFYKQSILDPRPENCFSFSKKSPQKIV